MPQLSALPASWLSATYHSNATRIIAFSLSCIAVTVQLGASLSHEIESYIELSTLGIAFERSEIIKHMGLSVVFLGLLLRYYWLVWRKGSSIPRGVDLVLHVGEMGLCSRSYLVRITAPYHTIVLWTSTTFLSQVIMREPFTLWDINTVCLLYIPSAMFLLVAKILDVVHSDNGIWFGLKAATTILQDANKSHLDRMSRTRPRLIVARIYLILSLVHIVGLPLFMTATDGYLIVFFAFPDAIFVTLKLVALSVSLVYHLQSFFVIRLLPRGLDFALILLQYLLLNIAHTDSFKFVPWPALAVVTVSERLSISILLAFRIWDVVQCGSRAREPFNLVPSYDIHASRIALLIGRNAWNNLSLRGEPAIIKSLRGILVVIALVGLGIFSAILISRNVASSQDEVTLKTFILNNPQSLYPFHYILLTPAEGISASAFINHPEILQITETCTPENAAYNCPVCSDHWSPGSTQDHSCWYCYNTAPAPAAACQVQIQVDFGRGTEIGAFAGPDYSQVLYVSMTFGGIDNTSIWKIPKVALRRNRALEGDLVFYQYEFIKKFGLTSFGVENSNQVIVGDVKSISNDPTYNIPNNLAYLKYRYSPRDAVVSVGVREYTDKTILGALAAIGGIWTFGNGLFTLVFGGSLLYFLLGLRPLSRLGFVHLFIQARLRQATREQYPNFHHEGGQPGETEAGVVSFIRQHLLGVVEDDEEEKERKKRRREWEHRRGEMELLSFEVVSGPVLDNPQRESSVGDGSIQRKEEQPGQEV